MSLSSHLLKIRISCPKLSKGSFLSLQAGRDPTGGLIIAFKSCEMKLNPLWVSLWTPCVSRAGTGPPCSFFPCLSVFLQWNLYILVRYSVTLRNVLLRSTENSLKINRKCCFISERLSESCADGHGILGHVRSSRIMSSCRSGNDCIVECDMVWLYHSGGKVKQVLVTLKINERFPFCGNVKKINREYCRSLYWTDTLCYCCMHSRFTTIHLQCWTFFSKNGWVKNNSTANTTLSKYWTEHDGWYILSKVWAEAEAKYIYMYRYRYLFIFGV